MMTRRRRKKKKERKEKEKKKKRKERKHTQMKDFLEGVLREIGPRQSCSAGERELGERLKGEWAKCDAEVHSHSFQCHPTAFIGSLRFLGIFYALSLVSLSLSPLLSFVLSLVSFSPTLFQLMLYLEVWDTLFPRFLFFFPDSIQFFDPKYSLI